MTVVEPSGRAPAPVAPGPSLVERSDGPSGGRRDWILTAVLIVAALVAKTRVGPHQRLDVLAGLERPEVEHKPFRQVVTGLERRDFCRRGWLESVIGSQQDRCHPLGCYAAELDHVATSVLRDRDDAVGPAQRGRGEGAEIEPVRAVVHFREAQEAQVVHRDHGSSSPGERRDEPERVEQIGPLAQELDGQDALLPADPNRRALHRQAGQARSDAGCHQQPTICGAIRRVDEILLVAWDVW
jgi:hypothetical protein